MITRSSSFLASQLRLAVFSLAALLLFSLAGCCATPQGFIARADIAPSADAITSKMDELLVGAVASGAMDPMEADTWRGELVIFRHLALGDPAEPVAAPVPLDSPDLPVGDPAPPRSSTDPE